MLRLILLPLAIAIISSYLMTRVSLARTRASLSQRSKPLHHPALARLSAQMAQAMDVEAIEVFELDDPQVNGFADADGRVFLTRGFLQKFALGAVSPEELASVIAHELGHVAHGHINQRLRDVTGQQAAVTLAGLLLSRFLPFVGPWLVARLSGAFMAHLSRKNEFEADRYASALLLKAGIGTGPQKTLFRKLERLTGARGAEIPAWMRSHPTVADRIAAIEANERRWLGQ